MPPIPLISALDAASVAYALINAEGGLLWANRAFRGLADAAGRDPEQHAAAVLQGEAATGAAVSPVEEPAGARLIEMTPTCGNEACGRPAVELDSLTKVLSRRELLRVVETWFASREERPFALVFVDLDDFKQVNDRHGHPVGDRCLAQIGGRLSQSVRGGDVVGRYGGDEFLVLLTGVADQATYALIAERLLGKVARPIDDALDGAPLCVTASAGVAFATADSPSVEQLITAADRAMYAQKGARG